jgi:cytochrome c-type biogenesis protein
VTFIDNIEQIIGAYPLLALGAVFLAGVISSASPCVLSTIPLVVGFVGGYSDGDRWKAFRYSLMFIIGFFGVVSGWWYAFAGIVALVMGGQLMGLYEIRLPVKRDFKPKQSGIVGAFILGLFFGLVSSPCATPVMVVLLTLVTGKGQVFFGIILMFSYAVGHCLLMLAVGTFTGFVEAFFKTRGVLNFSSWSRKASGLIISLAGAWFIWQAF